MCVFFLELPRPEACGPDATCINRPSGRGYDCRCHLGKFGDKCMEGKTRSNCIIYTKSYTLMLALLFVFFLFFTKYSVTISIFFPTW